MKTENEFLAKVKTTIKKFGMIKPKHRILIGLSGGPDSICLLHVLNRLKQEFNIKIYAFHLNHKLRGKESEADEKFVKEFCRNLRIPFRIRSAKVKEYAKKNRLSLEQAAREIRYRRLEQEQKRLSCDRIGLGHNADDNAETVILNLIRGTGLKGLAGIPPFRDNIVRPLIKTERKAIIQYLKANRIDYRTDSTNLDTKIKRNFVRIKIMPQLKRLNPNLIETVSRISAMLRADENYLDNITKEILNKLVIRKSKNRTILDSKELLSYNVSIRRRVLKSLLPEMGFDKIEKILQTIEQTSVGSVTLSQNLVAKKEYDRLYIGKISEKPGNQEISIPVGRSLMINEMGVELETAILPNFDLAEKDRNTEVFDYDKLSPPFYLRYRKAGDRFTPFGGKEKKLKEVLIDDKIPERLRNQLPLFGDSQGVLWILGGRRAERGRIMQNTKKFLLVRIKKWKNQFLRTD